jgi:hypothetical protein
MRRVMILSVSFMLMLGGCVSVGGQSIAYSDIRFGIPYDQEYGIEAYYSMNDYAVSPLFAGYEDAPFEISFAAYDWNTYVILDRWGEPIGFAIYESRTRVRVVDVYGNITNYLLWIGGEEYQIIGRDGYVVGQIRLDDGRHYSIYYRGRDLGYLRGPEFGFFYTNDRHDQRQFRRHDYFRGRDFRHARDGERRNPGRRGVDSPAGAGAGRQSPANQRERDITEGYDELDFRTPSITEPTAPRQRSQRPARRRDVQQSSGNNVAPPARATTSSQPQPQQQARPRPRRPQDRPNLRQHPNNQRPEEDSQEDPPQMPEN